MQDEAKPGLFGPPLSTFMLSAFLGSVIWSDFLMMSSCQQLGKSMLPAGRLTMPMAPSAEYALE